MGLIYNSEFSVLYSQTIRARKIIQMILSSFLGQEEAEPWMSPGLPKIAKLVCGSSGTGTQFFSLPACVLTWHTAAFVLSCSFNFSLNLIFCISHIQVNFHKHQDSKMICYWTFSQIIDSLEHFMWSSVLSPVSPGGKCVHSGACLTFLLRCDHIMKGSFIVSLYKRQR